MKFGDLIFKNMILDLDTGLKFPGFRLQEALPLLQAIVNRDVKYKLKQEFQRCKS